jgi:Xaa-Pro aminopeptidase
MTEIEIGQMIDAETVARGGQPSFETIVNAGDKTSPGHGRPTKAKLESGDLLHVDFGVRLDGYCSDIQRLLYFRRPNELGPPAELTDAFEMVSSIITATAQLCRPGVKGYEVDIEARNMLSEHGYKEYEHALGHQLGRAVHDGGALLGPKWERYGKSPSIRLAEKNVFTLELEIILPGIGCVGLEEDIVVTPKGGQFLGPRQLELGLL